MPDGTTAWDERLYDIEVTTCTFNGGGGGGGGGDSGGAGGGGAGGGSGGVTGDDPPPQKCTPPSPPALESVKGKIIINVYEGGGTGGGGGTGSVNPPPCSTGMNPGTNPQQIITDKLNNPCLKNVLNKITQTTNLNGKIADIIHDVFATNDKVNLTFEEYTSSSDGPAQTLAPIVDNNGIYNEDIKLNLYHLKDASQEFSAIIMVHETLHAYMNYNGQFLLNQLYQHQEMADKYVTDIKNFIQQSYPINDADAYSIILNGLKDIFKNNTPLYLQTLQSKYHVTDPAGTYEAYRGGIEGTMCK